jgi:hypothetical protein
MVPLSRGCGELLGPEHGHLPGAVAGPPLLQHLAPHGAQSDRGPGRRCATVCEQDRDQLREHTLPLPLTQQDQQVPPGEYNTCVNVDIAN